MFRHILVLASFFTGFSAWAVPAEPPIILNFPQRGVEVEASFTTPPELMKRGQMKLQVVDPKSRQQIEIADSVKVTPYMFMPGGGGHGSRPTTITRPVDAQGQISPGLYQVDNVFFTMGGKWEVRVELKSSDGRVEEKSFPLEFAGGHGSH